MSLPAALGREAARRLRALIARSWIATHPRRAAAIQAQRAWLIGGTVGRAYGDNSAALHQHLRQARPDRAVFWVINRGSVDVAAARRHGAVLWRESVDAHVRAMLAEVIVISHGVHDVPGCGSRDTAGAVRVRLGHGLTALKRTLARAGHDNATANAMFDLVPVASAFEAGHKADWGIAPDRLIVTGLARFDTLLAHDRAVPTERTRILYMPTWRDGGGGEAFAQGLEALLGAPALGSLLDAHDACLEVFLHINIPAAIRARLQPLANAWVRFVDGHDPQAAFARAGLLVTDWSSVAWDMLYLDKPVLFYQFDAQAFAHARGGYVDDAMPGQVARTAAEALDEIARHLDGRWAADPARTAERATWQARAFAFRDDRNCARIVAAVEARLRGI